MSVIDTHVHLVTRDAPLSRNATYLPAYEAGVDHLIDQQSHAKVVHGVLVQPVFYGTDNRVILDALQRYVNRFRAVVSVSPSVPARRLQEWDKLGVRGVRFDLTDPNVDLASAPMRVLIRSIADLGWLVELNAPGDAMAYALAHLAKCRAPIVVEHFGHPEPGLGVDSPSVKAILNAPRQMKLYVKMSAPYRSPSEECRALVARYLDALGPAHLMWGSEWPWIRNERRTSYQACLMRFNEWVARETDRHEILCRTPMRVFGFPASDDEHLSSTFAILQGMRRSA